MDSALQAFRDRRNAEKADGIPVAKKDTLKAPSRKNNNRMQAVWDNYKAKNPDADLQEGETLIEFVWDYARHSKGKISDRSSIHTLDQYILRFAGMMKVDHGIKIPEKNIEDARQFLKGDLKEELSLSDSQYDKGFADWEDIKIIIKHGLAYDEHQYHDERHRLQLVFLFLLISDDGERIGAIARSDCYREEERALTYNVGITKNYAQLEY
ncbi:hypothetical protein HYALB_00010031 [Hymenoscyphus albidus]|uniref:Uncharacterized protein n=1 Tax=Hymenoscyphus albidus TaxID=595503 RepID=A0A9N9LRD4_9HELO|nr:hypothetical protein HYALB_00010031 [Hymenoscyphus albidus]